VQTVKRNSAVYKLPLRVVSYKDIYDGWTMDRVVRATGLRNNCTYCGVFRRNALELGARMERAEMVATGHNADDVAETVLMNILRGDVARLPRSVDPITGGDGTAWDVSAVPRCKPLLRCYEKEIVLYAFHNKLDYFSTECVYSPNAYRGFAREYIKAVEAARPSSILDTIHAGVTLAPLFTPLRTGRLAARPPRACERCGAMSSQTLCQTCTLLLSLEGSASSDGSLSVAVTEGARLVPSDAPVVRVRGGTGVRGGPEQVLELSGRHFSSGQTSEQVDARAQTLRSVSWAAGRSVDVRGKIE
jgi:cytoplasmic tRNA 2-thiolation protein 1